MNNAPLIPMGYVRGAVGILGWLKIKADTEFADSLLNYPHWLLGKDGQWQEFALQTGRLTADGLQVKLVGIDDRTAAETLRGMTIAVSREDFPETAENEFYWADLIGMTVKNPTGNILGTVKTLIESGAHDLLVLDGEEHEILIPFVAKFILNVDRDNSVITADWEADY